MTENSAHKGSMRATARVVTGEPPKVVHVVNFSRLGTDIVMSMGRLDIVAVSSKMEELRREGKNPADEMELEVEVFDRFAMSPDAFVRLVTNANVIYEAMKKSGDIKALDTEEEANESPVN